MTQEELLNLETQVKVIHPIWGKCRIVSVGQKALEPVITVIHLSPDSSPTSWREITDYQNLALIAWDWEHEPMTEASDDQNNT